MKLRNQSCQLILGHYSGYLKKEGSSLKVPPKGILIPLMGILFPS